MCATMFHLEKVSQLQIYLSIVLAKLKGGLQLTSDHKYTWSNLTVHVSTKGGGRDTFLVQT